MRVLEKSVKIASSVTPPPDSHVVTLTYYYNFIEFVPSIKCILLTSKKDKMTRTCSTVTFSASIFHFKLCRLYVGGAQEYYLPQGAGYPSYASALHVVPVQCLGYAAKKFLA